MNNVEEIVKQLDEKAVEIQRFISNYKKTPHERRTIDYVEQKAATLQDLWSQFEQLDRTLRNNPNAKEDHPYFTKEIHAYIGTQFNETITEMTAAIKSLKQKNLDPVSQAGAAVSSDPRVHNLVCKQNMLINVVRNMLSAVLNETTLRPPRYYDTKAKLIQHHWDAVQKLHMQILDAVENLESAHYSVNTFIETENSIHERLMEIQAKGDVSNHASPEQPSATTPSVSNLPKVTLPKFDGNYLKWKPFRDMFHEMIHSKPLQTIQKMFYLKTNLSGEAERLISHLAITEENYSSAWNALQERYDNKRLIVNSLLDNLLSQPKHSEASVVGLKNLHDTSKETLAALSNLGIDTEAWGPILLYLLIKKLDRTTHLLFEQSLQKPREIPSFQCFLQFLDAQFQSLEALGIKHKSSPSTRALTTVVNQQTTAGCKFCGKKDHYIYRCKEFLLLSIQDKNRAIQKRKLCYNCLRESHQREQCKSRGCLQCGKKHNTLLHASVASQQDTTERVSSQNSHNEHQSTSLMSTKVQPNISSSGYVLLGTVKVSMVAANGQGITCKAILDSGSQINLITERLQTKLGLHPEPAILHIEGIGRQKGSSKGYISTEINSCISNFSARITAFVVPKIVAPQPAHQLDLSNWTLPDCNWADPEFYKRSNIDLLIGAELYYSLLSSEKQTLAPGLPILQNTVFGWMCAGRISCDRQEAATCGIYTKDEEMMKNLEKFWELEEVTTTSQPLTTSERACETHYAATTIRDQDGRFVVRLPFKEDVAHLGDSRRIAMHRFHSLEKRLDQDTNLKEGYKSFMAEYEALGHMTKVVEVNRTSPCYFIPHHCIQRPESSTTKLRVVFDASSKTSTGIALNDILHIGPTIQSELFSILLRFRLPRYVFTSDIEKMYRQIVMNPTDRNLQLILWRKNKKDKLNTYQLNTVTYGTRSAPYLAIKCLQQLGKQHSSALPLGAKALLNDFYVDDCLTGADTLATALEIQRELTTILGSAGFKLRKWCANHPGLLQGIPDSDQEVNLDFDSTDDAVVKTLGLRWRPKTDHLCIRVNVATTQQITKRIVLSEVAKIFDPLGILAPVVVSAKLIIQELWQAKLSWDDPLPHHLHAKWMRFRNGLADLTTTKFDRRALPHGMNSSVQLHAFSDASEKAYGAAIYLRSISKDKITHLRLLCAKSRVAPTKKQTLPRLELCAAVIAAQLVDRVKRDIDLASVPTFLWTDSEIVLAWINASSSSFQTFVANRVATIQNVSTPLQWRHVPSKDNPADLLSRGVAPDCFSNSTLWFYGPVFLHRKESSWCVEYRPRAIAADDEEVKKRVVATAVVSSSSMSEWVYNINHHNSFEMLVHIVAYLHRFISHSRMTNKEREKEVATTPREERRALTTILRTIQAVDFKDEIGLLLKGNELKSKSPLLSLKPFIGDDKLLRVGGRLEHASIPYDAKHPVILPYNDPLVKLLLKWWHEEHHHCGPQTLLGLIRQRFWPIKGKLMARSIVQQCVPCTKARPKLFQQIMGDLPASRVVPARPFINSGVDFCGPFWIHYKIRGKRPQKAYVAVFCCFTTKAVHLEIVSDLTSESFIGCLKRFIGRRGHCQNLYCDNATNFVGAKSQLKEVVEVVHSDQSKQNIARICNKKGISFHFIPPRAPHFGGLWEAAVKSAKTLFVKSIANASLTYEELETVMVEIEAILNSRPLTPVSNDASDFSILTPGHFLIGEPLTATVDTYAAPLHASLLTRWKLVSHLKHEFWKRWSREYLCELQYRNKWKTHERNAEPGMMVILKEDNTAPLQWPLGRIIKTYSGNDNQVRVADVQTAKGVLKRAIHKLAPLPLQAALAPSDAKSHHNDIKDFNNETKSADTHAIKRRRLQASSVGMISMLAILLIGPVIMGQPTTIHKFTQETGIYFEQIGTSYIQTSNWRLVVFYNLNQMQLELKALHNGTKTLNNLCGSMRQQTLCENLVSQFQHIDQELQLSDNLLTHHRQKRGALNVVGNVANALFGLLDNDYAAQMAETIKNVQTNENVLLQHLKNQTSIIDSTLNIMKRDQEESAKTFGKFENKLTTITQLIQSLQTEHNSLKGFQLVTALGLELSLAASNIQRIQSELISVIINVHHGQISPLLLSSTQLAVELRKIRAHLPPTTEIAGDPSDLLSVYGLMTVQAGVTENCVIFQMLLPLRGTEQFNLFRLIPIPTSVNNTGLAIRTSTPILAVTLHRDKYFPTTFQELNQCQLAADNSYLCPNTQPIYHIGSKVCACEISLFNNQTRRLCEFTHTSQEMWIKTTATNQWMFALQNPNQITTVCGTEVYQQTIEGAGLLTINPDCILKTDFSTIVGTRSMSTNTSLSYTSYGTITEIAKPNQSVLQENHEERYWTQLRKLDSLHDLLNNATLIDLPRQLQTTRNHHYVVGYLALILVIIVGCLVMIRWVRRNPTQSPAISTPRETPTPQPRTSTAPDLEATFVTTFS